MINKILGRSATASDFFVQEKERIRMIPIKIIFFIGLLLRISWDKRSFTGIRAKLTFNFKAFYRIVQYKDIKGIPIRIHSDYNMTLPFNLIHN